MPLPNQFVLSNLSEIIIEADGTVLDIYPYVRKIEITESLFSSFIRGAIEINDTSGTRILRKSKITGGPNTKIEFSFSGAEGTEKTPQPEITISKEEYRVFEIVPSATEGRGQYLTLYFVHKSFFANEKKKISLSFRQEKVSDIVKSLGDTIELEWEEIEPTHNNITTTLTYNNCMDHISSMTKYATRKSNINDVNYLFWQNLKGKHNFVSLGKLYTQKPSFGQDIESGFIFGNNISDNYDITRRLVSKHTPIGRPVLESAMAGLYSSAMVFVDKSLENGSETILYDIRDEWDKQSHLSNKFIIDDKSTFWEEMGGSYLTRVYNTSRHNYCCNEKKGGQRNERFCAPRRLSQLAQAFQLGLNFVVSGNSNVDEISAGKIVYFGRPLNYDPDDVEQEDIFYSGKYLIVSVIHVIEKGATPVPKYSCVLNCYKDSIGEE